MQYSKTLMDHFKNPRNQGKIKNADMVGQAGNPLCGDVMKMYLRVKAAGKGKSDKDVIKDIKFETLGCGAAIANSSILTTMVKGKTIKDAMKISRDDIAKALGGVPPAKLHCSILATEALKEAIDKYLR